MLDFQIPTRFIFDVTTLISLVSIESNLFRPADVAAGNRIKMVLCGFCLSLITDVMLYMVKLV